MVPTASASPVNEILAVLNETSPAIHMTPGITTNFTNPTLKEWPHKAGILGFPDAHLGFYEFGRRGTFEQTGAVLLILEDKVREWRAGAGMSI